MTFGPFPKPVATVTGNTGGTIYPNPSTGNLNIVGSGTISVSGSGHSLTIAGGGLSWFDNPSSIVMVVNMGYLVKSSSAITLTVPLTSAVGDTLEVMWVSGGGGVTIQANAGQILSYADTVTSSGGTLSPTAKGNAIHLICVVASTTWMADFMIGSFTKT